MDRNYLVPTPIVDKNGVLRRVHKRQDEISSAGSNGPVSKAASKGETGIERTRRTMPAPVVDPDHVTGKDAAKQAFSLLAKGLSHGDGASVIAGAIAFAGASVAVKDQLRSMEWAGNPDLSRNFVIRIANMDVNKPLLGKSGELAKAQKPVETFRGPITMPELKALDEQHTKIEEDARTALSEHRHIAADLYENEVLKNLVKLVLEDHPAAKADELAQSAREYPFSDKGGWYFKPSFPFVGILSVDSQEFRDAKSYAAEQYEKAAKNLRAAREQR